MTGPRGAHGKQCKFRNEVEGNIEVEGKQNSLFLAGSVIKSLVTPPDSKLEKKKTVKKSFALRRLAHKLAAAFKKHNLIMCDSKVHVVVSLGS